MKEIIKTHKIQPQPKQTFFNHFGCYSKQLIKVKTFKIK
jgi:hypothetical protein